jgi:hypothetical protein
MSAESLMIAAGCGIIIVIVAIVSPLVLDGARWCPEDGKPALAFTITLLWPLSLIVGIGCAIWLAGRMLGRSFAVLWRAWRLVRVRVPRATAKERPMPRRRSPYLRDRLAERPVFRDRDRPLPMYPSARCNRATAATLPTLPPGDLLTIQFCAVIPRAGSLEWRADDSIPDGVIEIDGTRITLAELRAACEEP